MSVFFQAAEIVIHMLISNVTSSLFGYILFYEHHLGLVQEFKKVTHIFLKLYWRNILPNKICNGLLSLFFQTLSNKCTKVHKTLSSRPFIVKGLHLHYHGLRPYIFISKVIKYRNEHMLYSHFTRCELIPPSYPTCFLYPYFWNLGVGKAGPKYLGEAENLHF